MEFLNHSSNSFSRFNFQKFHCSSHGGAKAIIKLIAERNEFSTSVIWKNLVSQIFAKIEFDLYLDLIDFSFLLN